MKSTISILFLSCLLHGATVFAQTDKDDRKEERAEKTEESKEKAKAKTDYNLFHRQMLALKEYSEERRKIPALQKANKMTVKIAAVVDSSDEDAQSKVLTGYIVQNIGDNSTNLYQVTFDRVQKKIITVKHTAEAIEAEKSDKADKDEKTEEKKTIHKKSKDDDDDDDDDAPAKGKEKEKDEDKD